MRNIKGQFVKGSRDHDMNGLKLGHGWNKGITCPQISVGLKGHSVSDETREKMRKAKLGRLLSLETRQKMSVVRKGRVAWNKGVPMLSRRGSANNFWKGGISANNLLIRASVEYKNWRRKVFERDNYTCRECAARNGNGKSIRLHAHHIKSFSTHPELRFIVSNGLTLCKDCHKKTDTYCVNTKYQYAA